MTTAFANANRKKSIASAIIRLCIEASLYTKIQPTLYIINQGLISQYFSYNKNKISKTGVHERSLNSDFNSLSSRKVKKVFGIKQVSNDQKDAILTDK